MLLSYFLYSLPEFVLLVPGHGREPQHPTFVDILRKYIYIKKINLDALENKKIYVNLPTSVSNNNYYYNNTTTNNKNNIINNSIIIYNNNNSNNNNSAGSSYLLSGACQGKVWSSERTGFPDFNLKHSLPALLVDCGDCGAPGRQLSSGSETLRDSETLRPLSEPLRSTKNTGAALPIHHRRPLPYGGFE